MQPKKPRQAFLQRLPSGNTLALIIALSAGPLAACGGGGGSDLTSPGSANPTSPAIGITGTTVRVAWNANPEPVQGYTVFYGPNPSETSATVADLPAGAGTQPAIELSTAYDLGLAQPQGQRVCFRVAAYNDAGRSDPSEAVCTTI